jgi:serine/threonine protein kinase
MALNEADYEERMQQYEIEPTQLEFQSKIGSGCTAEVFLGRYNGHSVAIKQIDTAKSEMGEKGRIAFERELTILPLVQHENLVQFLGICSLRKPFRVITEFCAGGCCFDLLHYSDHVELVWWQKQKMFVEVAYAMDYLHRFNPQIIHRDLKSLNLLLKHGVLDSTSVPFIKVSDFGMSRMKDGLANAWGPMTMATGTCNWMAPEVFSGCTYDEKVDVYSFAMILYEIICRELPFDEDDPATVGKLAVTGVRPDIDDLPPDCPPSVSELMVACWAGDPNQRPSFSYIAEFFSQCG